MTLLDRQIKAVEETLDQVIGECKGGVTHHWRENRCPLCRLQEKGSCEQCPLSYCCEYEEAGIYCVTLSREFEDEGGSH